MPLMQQWFPIALVVALHASAIVWLLQANPMKQTTPPEVMEIVFFSPQDSTPVEAVAEPLPVPPPPPPPPPQVKPEPPKLEKKVERPPVIDTPSPVVAEKPVIEPAPEPAPQPQPPVQQPPAPKVETPAPATPQQNVKPTAPTVDASHRGNRKPVYPPLSRRLGEEGTVMVRVLVKGDGTAGEVRLEKSSGFPRLDHSAVEAVKRWKFKPAMRGTTPVDEWFSIPVEFNLES